MFEIGRVVVKVAGRDAGLKGVVIEKIDDNFVIISGQVRRRKCNINHLEPLDFVLDIKKNASQEEVAKALKEINVEVSETKPKQKTERLKKKRASASRESEILGNSKTQFLSKKETIEQKAEKKKK